MKPLVLLFWIFVVTVHTFVLQPSVNVTVLQNASAEGDLWGKQRLTRVMEALNAEEEKRSEEEVKIRGAEKETNNSNEEHGMKETEMGQTMIRTEDAEEKENQQGQSPDEPDTLDFTRPTLKQYNTPSISITSHPVLLTESATPPPSFSSTPQRPASAPETLYVITNTNLSSETTVETPKFHTPDAMGTTLLNESRTNDDLKVELHVMNVSELHLKEEVSVEVTALSARAGPTAKALPSTFTDKAKSKVAKHKDNKTLKGKKKKAVKGKPRKTTKVSKKAKKVKKLNHEQKLKPTTPSHFPYFEDNYCPSECSCYGRVVQCSDKHLVKIPYGIPYNSRYILLMNNKIDSIQLNLLSQYDSMEFLVLRNNRLTDSAVKKAFEGIQRLKRLYVERNLLRSIPTDLPATLEELRLDWNQISAMSNAAFERCPSLQILSLSNNTLLTIPPGVLLPLGSLRTLTLSYNQLASVPMQLPLSLRELYLRGNRIQRLQGDMFWGESELQILDLSLNRLTDKGLGKAALLNATGLESLNLEGNLLKRVPRHLPHTIKTLNLEGNFILSITKDAFVSMPQLEHLGLARNKIAKVALGAFRVLPLLHQLDMSYNALEQVPRQLPLWLHSATFMHNNIRSIPRDAFCWGRDNVSPLSRLVKVQLEYNMIDLGHLDTLAFRCLRGFQVVELY
ncbi:wu:fc23c09 precursor [Danio rerio]|uniref:Wu:fc23c09 n=1 Tax=Danio rerio TaxID=7955 RepID=E7EXM1_DANRE|nr:wu:fc23c09 precursor [Danio rerio]|eukprot:XP_005164829.1 podocan-like protein 1 [Danio rerio]